MKEDYPSDFKPTQNKILYTKSSSFWIDNGIIYIYSHSDVIHTIEDAKQCVALLDVEIPNQKVPMICDVRKAQQLPKEVRRYYASEEGTRHCTKFAFIVSSAFSRVVANFFIGFTVLKHPIKMFEKPENAVKWCKK